MPCVLYFFRCASVLITYTCYVYNTAVPSFSCSIQSATKIPRLKPQFLGNNLIFLYKIFQGYLQDLSALIL